MSESWFECEPEMNSTGLESFDIDLSSNRVAVANVASAQGEDPFPPGNPLGPLTWASSDELIAHVTADGNTTANIMGVGDGTVTITATDTTTGVQATALFEVSSAPMNDITVDTSDLEQYITYTGTAPRAMATIDADAIDHVTMSLVGIPTGLSNGDSLTVKIVADLGYNISGYGSSADFGVTVTKL